MTRVQQPRFDRAMFHAALAYYGLPAGYHRFFTRGESLRRHEVRRSFLTVGEWWFYNAVPAYPVRDSAAGRVVWAQVNLPATGFPHKKAETPDIECYQNLTLDFEYPADPALAIAMGREMAAYLLDLDLAKPHPDWLLDGKPSLPFECSGAGVHICLPMLPLQTAALGGGEIVDDAVQNIVLRFIQPQFDTLVARAALASRPHLDGYDLGHLFSLPGTWRPPNLKKDECSELRSGVLRHWYRDASQQHGRLYPRRRESALLAELIVDECAALSEMHSDA